VPGYIVFGGKEDVNFCQIDEVADIIVFCCFAVYSHLPKFCRQICSVSGGFGRWRWSSHGLRYESGAWGCAGGVVARVCWEWVAVSQVGCQMPLWLLVSCRLPIWSTGGGGTGVVCSCRVRLSCVGCVGWVDLCWRDGCQGLLGVGCCEPGWVMDAILVIGKL